MDNIKLAFNTPTPKKLKTICVVEDNPMEQTMIVDYFGKYKDLIIKAFSDGESCIKEIVKSNVAPDLILLDYFLDSTVPTSKDGLEIMEKLKELSPNSNFIMLTSVENDRIKNLASKKGILGYIIKDKTRYNEINVLLEKYFTKIGYL